MGTRPRLQPAYTKLDRFIELISGLFILGIWCLVTINYGSMPEEIPTHFTLAGEPDAFKAKNHLFILPGISTLLFISMMVLNKFPHHFNYPIEINQVNAFYQYSNATRLIRVLNLVQIVIFGLITFNSMLIAAGMRNGLGSYFFQFTSLLIGIPLIYFAYKAFFPK